ncbi:ankyrin repeat domain protein [Nitzschia inconspicua]|uniref:Ankyrin repeat domain protein n=1 Tax=Nitzschia inconspicua TaxID=303405 RepID=A0A9K3PBG5_9STRA|nr:ankyrin repeat domain protein [Nitzschia inconspicua]
MATPLTATAADSVAAPAARHSEAASSTLPMDAVRQVIDACAQNDLACIEKFLQQDAIFACQQDLETGLSPLMAASQAGHLNLVQQLLELGAPWNAIDRQGKCAGNYATDNQHWDVVNLLVDWGTRAELILGELQRSQQRINGTAAVDLTQDSSTKPDYLQQSLHYNADGTALLDADEDAVMMEWERPIMRAHAQVLLGDIVPPRPRRVLNVGFGMGIIDTILQSDFQPTQHYIIEAHPDVYQKMIQDGWDKKQGVTICHGKWQDVLPQLAASKVEFDGIFFDTYAEHAMDMEDFHRQMTDILVKPGGIYSFFNGLAPDNLFFHGVACNVIKLQLDKLGFDTEFLTCQIQVQNINNDKVWQGIRRKYWHNRDVYYLPRVTWNQEFLGRKTKVMQGSSDQDDETMDMEGSEDHSPLKRQRRIE